MVWRESCVHYGTAQLARDCIHQSGICMQYMGGGSMWEETNRKAESRLMNHARISRNPENLIFWDDISDLELMSAKFT